MTGAHRASRPRQVGLGEGDLQHATRAYRATLQKRLRHHLGEHHLAYLGDDVALVVTELATNAMRHAHTAFTVHLHAYEQILLLEVGDGSRAVPVRLTAVNVLDSPVLDTDGRGLAIVVENLCRDWGTDALPSGGKSVWAKFNVP